VYKAGIELKDPDTGEVLGVEEVNVGKVRVISVLPKVSKAEIIGADTGVAEGAIVRPAQTSGLLPSNSAAPVFPTVILPRVSTNYVSIGSLKGKSSEVVTNFLGLVTHVSANDPQTNYYVGIVYPKALAGEIFPNCISIVLPESFDTKIATGNIARVSQSAK
jgi:hypothetical protein